MKAGTGFAFAVLLLFAGGGISAQNPSGYDIMKLAEDRYTGDTAQYKLSMTLSSGRSAPRVREVSYYFKDYGDTEAILMVFRSPRDVAGTAYLSFSYDDESRDDDIRLYVPAIKRVERISGRRKNDDFMGTDFTYEDMGSRSLGKDDYSLLGEEDVEAEACWVVEARAKDGRDPYGRRIIRVRKDSYVIAGVDYYDRQNRPLKELRVSGIGRINGVWTALKMEMTNLQSKHSTVIEISGVTFNLPLDDGLFEVTNLERGNPR
ncbi:MAG: outer membrane lipoprotein-sorting protein [Treponema sp.]|jgi:hypothetical protein|nr:outer membrane lipoprotein-sorting protein [Treponema sp.]